MVFWLGLTTGKRLDLSEAAGMSFNPFFMMGGGWKLLYLAFFFFSIPFLNTRLLDLSQLRCQATRALVRSFSTRTPSALRSTFAFTSLWMMIATVR